MRICLYVSPLIPLEVMNFKSLEDEAEAAQMSARRSRFSDPGGPSPLALYQRPSLRSVAPTPLDEVKPFFPGSNYIDQ